MKTIQAKMKGLECSHSFSHCTSMGIFFKRLREANSAVRSRIWQTFELIQAFMVVLLTCKNEEDSIKNESANGHSIIHQLFRRSRADNSGVCNGVWKKFKSFKLLCMFSLPARMKMIQSKMDGLEWSQNFSHYKSMGIFPDAQEQLTSQSLVKF